MAANLGVRTRPHIILAFLRTSFVSKPISNVVDGNINPCQKFCRFFVSSM